METLLVFCHLRWNFVFQRPQHLMRRLASAYRVFYFEEPVYEDGPARLEIEQPCDGVWVCRPYSPVRAHGFHDEQLPVLQTLLEDLLKTHAISDPIVWLYTPMALPLIQRLDARLLVYDCMDELSAFKNAPRQLLQRERALLKAADLVFTGGPSLFKAKRNRHPAVYCFPSSVDKAHFASAKRCSEHPALASLPHPRLGFFGVIDERIDLELLADLAAARRDWQIVMVGPVVKIDPASLPAAPNIHYLGQRGYEELPSFLAGWDACLLPFALNGATRFISPTKTLEYMAAEKPVISTAVTDVVTPYSDVVRIANRSTFVTACDQALHESPEERDKRAKMMNTIVDQTSWDITARQMKLLLQQRPTRENAVPGPRVSRPDVIPHSIVIIGAGPTGLSAAYHAGPDSLLLEQNSAVGGWCRSIQDRGFTFDHAGHIMFSTDPYVHELYELLLKDNVHWQDREAWIFSNGVHTRYPFQSALYGLPAAVVSECLVGAIEARLGASEDTSSLKIANGSSPSSCKAESLTDCCADGIVEGNPVTERPMSSISPKNFEDFIYRVWGRGVAKHFALPYNRKLWALPLSEMETSWLGGRVPLPDLKEMVEGALQPLAKPVGPNARFGYPLRGGFQALMDGFLPHLRGELRLNARVMRLLPKDHMVELEDGTTYQYQQLISTMPLPKLVAAAGAEAPDRVHKAAAALRHVSVRCVNLGIGRPALSDKHWIYYPGPSVFHRVFLQGNSSPHVNAPGGFALTCEITYGPDKPLPCDGEALIERCIADCIDVGLIRKDDPVVAQNQVDMPFAYVVYDHARESNVAIIRQWAIANDIVLAGRYSEWEYYNSDHAFLAGRKAVQQALQVAPWIGTPASEVRLGGRVAGVASSS